EPLASIPRRLRRHQGRPRPALTGARLGLAALALALLAAGCVVPGILVPENDLLRDVYLRGSPRTPVVALTFDDGPNGRCTEAVLDALRDTGAPAAFFVLGAN